MRRFVLAAMVLMVLQPVTASASGPTCFGEVPTTVIFVGNNGYGTPGDDVIILEGNQGISAGGGNDLICGSDGGNSIDGGAGNDKIRGAGERDRIQGGEGNDLVRGDGAKDRLKGGPGDDVVKGGEMRDELSGQEGDDLIYSGSGIRWGGAGTFFGDPGNDVFVARLPSTLNFKAMSSPVQIDLKAGTLSGEEIGKDRITGPIYKIVATSGDDRILGSPNDEYVLPGEGRDVVELRGGDDEIFNDHDRSRDLSLLPEEEGPPNDDSFDGGSGSDSIYVHSAGRVVVNLRTGVVRSEDGIDQIEDVENASASDDALLIGDKADNELMVWGGEVRGGGGNDFLWGTYGAAAVFLGGSGDDKIVGSPRGDIIDGGGGVDRLNGKGGRDACRRGEVLLNCET